MSSLLDPTDTQDEVTAWMRFICNCIYYYASLGDYWYENTNRSVKRKIIYAIWATVNVGAMVILVLSEVLSLTKPNLTMKERYDAVQFSVAHSLVVVKMICIVQAKPKIKVLLKRMLVDTRQFFIDKRIEKNQVVMAQIYCFCTYISMVICMLFVSVDGLVFHFNTGSPWRTLVTIYPPRENLSYFAYFVRGFISFLWYHLITSMCCSDFLAITNLIYCSYKFKALQQYFRNLRVKFETNPMNKTQDELESEMQRDFIKGIQLHREIVLCAKNIQASLGNLYSFQLTQSGISFVNCLAQLVTISHSISNFLSIMTFMLCMLVLTAVYMWSSGEITYEASLVTDAIFDCGWQLCSARARLRQLLVTTMVNSQVPVIMTAFGIVELSYENFLKIIKHSYSFFAVLY